MKNNRRDFLKKTSVAGLGMVGAIACTSQAEKGKPFPVTHQQKFNMSGYIAPKLDVVRIAVIGLGNRGSGTVNRLACIEGVEIKALCDLVPAKVDKAFESISPLGHKPDLYSGNENDWKKICERTDLDLIAVVTPWHLHTPMCVYAMEHDKHAYTELPAAITVDECWQLVETSERTRKHCVQMSSNCHVGMSAVVLNMVRQGYFGDIIHAEGAYIHDILRGIFSYKYEDMWRLRGNMNKNGNLYPQHGLVPIIQMMDINYGDKMDFLVSVSTNDFMTENPEVVGDLKKEKEIWDIYKGNKYRGNMNTTIIRTSKGRTIMMQHDTSSPRPDVRFNLISGTKGIYQAGPPRIATSHDGWLPPEEFKALVEKYTPILTKRFAEITNESRGIRRGGRSYDRVSPTDWRLVDCLRNGLPMDIDVYEAAVSSSIIPLSVWSVANGSLPVDVPDFTSGKWQANERGMDINLQRGGTTKLI
jgi:hypothetical protein